MKVDDDGLKTLLAMFATFPVNRREEIKLKG